MPYVDLSERNDPLKPTKHRQAPKLPSSAENGKKWEGRHEQRYNDCMAAESPGPYCVERVDTFDGPRWRLIGPGLVETKAYPWEEFGVKLNEMAELMNFAWKQAQAQNRDEGATD